MTSTTALGAAATRIPGTAVLSDAPPDHTGSPLSSDPRTTGSTRPGSTRRVQSAEGLGSPVARATELLSDVLARLDPATLTGPDAARLYTLFAGVERLSMAGKTLLAPRIDESGVWRDGGHRTSAVMLAELEGVPTGQARNTLEVGQRLSQLPGTEEALRNGYLSGPKVAELSGAAVLDPGNEASLLAGAADQPLQLVKERCQRARATAERHDPIATVRRIHGARHFSSWTDSEGAFCFQGRDTADRGALILEQMNHAVARLRKARRSRGGSASAERAEAPPVDSDRALRADAFFLLMTGRSPADPSDGGRGDRRGRGPDLRPRRESEIPTGVPGTGTGDDDPGPPADQITPELDFGTFSPPRMNGSGTGGDPPGVAVTDSPPRTSSTDADDVIDRPPTCSVMVRVDLDALLRGHSLPGEVCEIDNQGPVPVAMARDMANDSFLRFVFHRAGDIRSVSHFGRTINRSLRTALAHRDRCCVVPGCGVPFGLEIDHVVPFAEGGPTELDNLALLCHHHHYLKTYEGWTLERTGTGDDGSTSWEFVAMPAFGKEPGLGID
ncbi:MAG: HNH endonuclease [Acidimicrobiales bacterium]